MTLQNFTSFLDEQYIRANSGKILSILGSPSRRAPYDPLLLQEGYDRITESASQFILGTVIVPASVAHICNEVLHDISFPFGKARLTRGGIHAPDRCGITYVGVVLEQTGVPPIRPLPYEIILLYGLSLLSHDLRSVRCRRNLKRIPKIRVFKFYVGEYVVERDHLVCLHKRLERTL